MSTKRFDEIVESQRYDIWRYGKLLQTVESESQIGSNQANWTPLEKIGECLVKREDKSITGSHKFRSLVYQLSSLKERGMRAAVLSSSGNAAISASHYVNPNEIRLFVFLSKKTPRGKLAALRTENITPILSSRPLRLAKYAAAKFKLPDLRPSVDPNAAIGFKSLGFEIFEQTKDSSVDNIFSFATSGASLKGISDAYKKLIDLETIDKAPKLYGVYSSGELTVGGDKHLKAIEKTCQESGGALIKVSDQEILSTRDKLATEGITSSNESISSLAAADKLNSAGNTVVIFTGKLWEEKPIDLNKFKQAENFDDVDNIITETLNG